MFYSLANKSLYEQNSIYGQCFQQTMVMQYPTVSDSPSCDYPKYPYPLTITSLNTTSFIALYILHRRII